MSERIYTDSDGNECGLATMCWREPGWAANRIATLEAQLTDERERNPVTMIKIDGDQARMFAALNTLTRIGEWAATYGASLKPKAADTYGEGVRDCKAQVKAMIAAMFTAVFAVACVDQSTSVNVAPSAQGGMEQIVDAIEYLNTSIGADVYAVTAVDHEHRVDGEIIVRAYDVPLDGVDTERRGESQQTTKGVIVRLVDGFSALAVAHELCHAAGLGHLDSEDNLMHPRATQWALTDAQIDALAGR